MNRSVLERCRIWHAYTLATGTHVDITPAASSIRVRCPSTGHDDKHPSCDLNLSKDVWICRACGAGGGVLDLIVAADKASTHADAARWLEEQGGTPHISGNRTSRVTGRYVYDDGADKAVVRIDRIEPGRNGREKDFLPYPAVNGGFAEKPGLNGIRPPVYRRSEVLKAARGQGDVYFVEGEGKADALRKQLRANGNGAAVTTIANGANSPLRSDHIADFAGAKRVTVLADSDHPGRVAANTRARQIADAHPSIDVRVIDLYPNRSDGVDVADWLEEGHTVVELVTQFERASRLAAQRPTRTVEHSHGRLLTKRAGDVHAKGGTFLDGSLSKRIPNGSFTVIDGPGGIGKTTVKMAFIAHATVGRSFFTGEEITPVTALVVVEEDGLGVLKMRLAASGANLSRVYFVTGVQIGDETEPFALPRHISYLEAAIEETGATLVYIDALFSHLELEGEGRMSQQIRRALRPIVEMVNRTGIAFTAMRHWTKSNGPASTRALGSVEISNVARSILTFGRHPESDERYVIASTKSNLAKAASAVAYRIEVLDATDDDGQPCEVTRAVLEGEVSDITADDLAMSQPGDPEERGAAQDWLMDYLGDAEWHECTEVYKTARRDGAGSPATIRRAAIRLGVEKDRSGFPSRSRWRLVRSDRTDCSSLLTPEYIANSEQSEQTGAARMGQGRLDDYLSDAIEEGAL